MAWLRPFGRRTLQSGAGLLVLILFVFVAGRLLGDPVDLILPEIAPQESRDALRASLGLDRPIHEQLWEYARNLIRGDFGESYWQNRPAREVVLERVPRTLYLAAVSIALAGIGGIGLGLIAALRPNTWLDKLIRLWSVAGISIVSFWLGLMLILVLSVEFRLFPTGGYGGLHHVVLPALTLAFRSAGQVAQMTRVTVVGEYAKPYVAAMRVRGYSEARILGHALRNAAAPVVTIWGDEAANQANGAVVVEAVFAWPGLGLLVVQALTQRDLVLVEAGVFTMGLIIVLVNALIDALYGRLNPRLRT